MAKSRKKTKASGGRVVSLILFLAVAGVLLWGRHELLWGLKGYLLDRVDFLPIESHSDLPPSSVFRVVPAEVVGIPDYKNALRFPDKDKILTCYRMVDFGNRLCVCTDKDLTPPKAIDEIIKERTIRGRLEGLGKSPPGNRLRGLFLKTAGIRLKEDAVVLYEEPTPLPSKVQVGLLAFCAILCCFFAYRLIK
jgi:hypothetical protein